MPRAHLDVEPEQVVRGEVERRAETLDLQRARELAADAVRDAVGRDDEEREEDERDDGRDRPRQTSASRRPRRRQT